MPVDSPSLTVISPASGMTPAMERSNSPAIITTARPQATRASIEKLCTRADTFPLFRYPGVVATATISAANAAPSAIQVRTFQ
jgi:hypothetical protein